MRILALTPMLQTLDLAATRAWYERVLGFACTGSEDGWLRLEREGAALMFMRHDHLGAPAATAVQYCYVDDAMAWWARISPHCTAEWGPERMAYGNLEFAVRDNNGYLLTFAQTP